MISLSALLTSRRCQSSLFLASTEIIILFKKSALKKSISSNLLLPRNLKVKREHTTNFLCQPVNNEALCNTNAHILEAEKLSKVFFLKDALSFLLRGNTVKHQPLSLTFQCMYTWAFITQILLKQYAYHFILIWKNRVNDLKNFQTRVNDCGLFF